MMTTPTAALVEEAQSMTTDTLIEEAMGEMHRLGIDNLRAKGAIVLLVEALRRAEAERDAQRAEVLRLTGELQQSRKESLERARTVLMLDEDFDEACALGFGLGCMLTNSREETEWQVEETRTLRREVRELSERLAGMPMLEDDDPAGKHLMSLINRRRELYQRVDELTATRDLLTAENARLQKERDAAAASLNALAKGARHVPCFGECASERICIACYGLQNLKGWVEWQKRTETERDEARSELAEARAHIATLELLRRGGK